MLYHYLKIAWRTLLKDKAYSVINLVGLSVAIACSFLLLFWIKFELSYERCYPGRNQIYRVLEEEARTEGIKYKTIIRPGIAQNLKSTFPQIQYAAYTRMETLPFTIQGVDGEGIMTKLMTTNPDFLHIFAYEYVEGSPESVIKSRGAIMAEETAKKFFGNKSAIGQTVNFGNTGMATFTISAVVKMPINTHISFDLLNPHNTNSLHGGVHYIKLKDGYSLSSDFEQQIARYLSTTTKTENSLKLQPIRQIHLHSSKVESNQNYGNLSQIYFFSGIALLILLIAVINYVNTAVARSMNRMQEVGVRKVFGANRRRLIERFLFEAFILSFFAVLLSLVFVELLFPGFSSVMGKRIVWHIDFSSILIIIGICILVTLLSGGYAAFYLSSFSPTLMMRGGSMKGSKEKIRHFLFGVQFFLSVSVLICTLFMYKQMHDIFNADTGVDKNNILILDTGLWYDAENFIQIIKKENPEILNATIASSPPYNTAYSYSGVSWTGCEAPIQKMEFTQVFCDTHYANTFGLQVIQGEFIPPNLSWWQDADSKSFNIVINEAFKKVIGEENPLGITVSYAWGMQGKIIGVVKDFNFKPLKEPISPLIISYNPETSNRLYIKTTGKNKKATIDYIFAKYKEMKPDYMNRPFLYHTVEDEYNEMYNEELRMARLLSVFSFVSLALAFVGIIGMLTFMLQKRTKEIAIRRINGAHVRDIAMLFARDILVVTAIASVIAVPLCYSVMHKWLQSYVYRTALSVWVFLAIPLIIMMIVFVIIWLQVKYTSRRNPADSLRN